MVYVKSMLFLSLFLLMMLMAHPVFSVEAEEKYEEEILHLISYLEKSGCKFQRNDSWYASNKAASHIRSKYNYLVRKNLVPDTDSFIERAASASSRSGRPYYVQCGNNPPLPSAQWLREELARYRSKIDRSVHNRK